MAKSNQTVAMVIPDELIMNKILFVRGLKVMIDSDLAELYGVTTKRLNEQVKRNIKRFPEDFMFQLTETEKQQVVANCDHLKNLKFSPYLPFVFTEHGAVMLASVLNSERAIQVNLQIVRVFIRMREMLATHKEILHKLEQIEKKDIEQDQKIMLIFEYLKQLEQAKQTELEQGPRKVIKGYRKNKE
jgi:phage regulator Rha-like protein